MSYISSRELLIEAQRGEYAVGAFNIENMEMAAAVVAAAEEMRAPVMIQTTPGTIRYASLEMYKAIVSTLASRASVPIALHLDHGSSFELAAAAVAAGYTSIMIDGSKLPFGENMAVSARTKAMAGDVPVEAELGTVGGKEDDTSAKGCIYTDPEDARIFVECTGIDSLAVAIGTAHGIYKGIPKLDINRLAEIRNVVSIPLVLHGASGVPDDQVRACVEHGICKVNYATELRIAYSDGVKAALAENPSVFDPKEYGKAGMKHVMEAVKKRIEICGSVGKA